MRRTGFTFVELVVVIAIIAILMALLFPAVQQARESANRMQCASQLKQIIVAVHIYEGANRIIPPGNSKGFSFHVAILPFLEQDAFFRELHEQIDRDVTPMDGNAVANKTAVPIFLCPSDSWHKIRDYDWAPTNYAGNNGTGLLDAGRRNGVFQSLRPNSTGNGPLTLAEISDGTSNTVAISEILPWDKSRHRLRVTFNTRVGYPENDPSSFELLCEACRTGDYALNAAGAPDADGSLHGHPWTFGDMGATLYTHSLPPGNPSCHNGDMVQSGIYSAASMHPNGMNVAYADGHVRVVSNSIDVSAWRSLGSRNDGMVVLE